MNSERAIQNAAKLLEQEMSDISEDYYCAGWLMELEYILWRAVHYDTPTPFGMGVITREQIDNLRQLAEDSGGWCDGERHVPMAEWLEEFARFERDRLSQKRQRFCSLARKQWVCRAEGGAMGTPQIETVDGEWVRGGGIYSLHKLSVYQRWVDRHNRALERMRASKEAA